MGDAFKVVLVIGSFCLVTGLVVVEGDEDFSVDSVTHKVDEEILTACGVPVTGFSVSTLTTPASPRVTGMVRSVSEMTPTAEFNSFLVGSISRWTTCTISSMASLSQSGARSMSDIGSVSASEAFSSVTLAGGVGSRTISGNLAGAPLTADRTPDGRFQIGTVFVRTGSITVLPAPNRLTSSARALSSSLIESDLLSIETAITETMSNLKRTVIFDCISTSKQC